MIISDQEIEAYVDGELAPAEASRIEAAIAGDVLVAARVERARRLRAQVRTAFDPILEEPVPQRLRALLEAAPAPRGGSTVVRLDERRAADAPRSPRWRTPAIAMAASVAALAIASWLRAPTGDIVTRGGALVARGALAQGLEHALAAAPDAAAPVHVGLSFRNAAGEVCRTFAQAGRQMAGLACRDGGGWRIEALTRLDAADGGGIRQASSALPPELQAAVDARIQGDAFDAAQERAAREAGWR